MKTITARDIGIVIDCSSCSADDLNYNTVRLAEKYGMKLTPIDSALLARIEDDCQQDDDSQCLSEMGDEALDYLNGLDLPAYCSFYFEDNSLFLFPCLDNVKEDVAFVSSREQDCPEPAFVGEWLHVSDHGNATLYFRDEAGKDNEIWSIV